MFVSITTLIIFQIQVLLLWMRLSRREGAISASISFGASLSRPCRFARPQDFSSQFRRRGERLYIILHTQNENGGFAIPRHQEAVVILYGAVHNLTKLSAGGKGGDLAGHID
jgi:hypothetical protein